MYDTGSTAFMIVCTMLVALMTPGLSFFYGGLSRRKNVVNTMMMVLAVIGVVVNLSSGINYTSIASSVTAIVFSACIFWAANTIKQNA